MKKVRIVCVGKIKESYLRDGIAEYAKRLSRYCEVKFVEIADYSVNSVQRESEHILSSLGEYNVLCDIRGKLVTSERFSKMIDDAYSLKASEITFIIGGSYGVSDEVKKRCDELVSFGAVTYPHQLMRLILCEQIYRAFTISEHTPYHK